MLIANMILHKSSANVHLSHIYIDVNAYDSVYSDPGSVYIWSLQINYLLLHYPMQFSNLLPVKDLGYLFACINSRPEFHEILI
jgi:hypothetical protein